MTLTEEQLAHWLASGQTAIEDGRYLDAARAFSQVHQALPGVGAVAAMAGQAWRLAGRILEARDVYIDVWRSADRNDIPALHDLGTTLLALGAPDEARACFTLVAAARPADPAAWSALASATRAAGDPQAAWPLVKRALAARPNEPAFLLTAAQIRHALGDLDGATSWLDRAAQARPDHAPTRLQHAFTSLLRGVSADGWALFEARQRPAPLANTRDWQGESLTGARIVAVAEQGLGDQFHFVRYVPLLRAYGASEVTIACEAPVVPLLRASGYHAVELSAVPEAEWSVPMLSLPHRLRMGADMLGAAPYLRGEGEAPANVNAVRPRRRLGIVWKGNPEFAATALRDFDVSQLAALTATPEIEWISLQYGEPVPTDCTHITPMPAVRDWLETARLIASLDGVVSVDTSVAHLAGAMHVPVYLLVPHAPDWRWGLHGTTTPWYPTMQLIRQPVPRDWAGTVPLLHAALHEACVATPAPRPPHPSR
jgi:tetratricopeptide (TPR) repeat protein